MTEAKKHCCEELRSWYLELVAEKPKIRPRDAAQALGVSEAELVACGVGAESFRLRNEWLDILAALKTVGEVMCLTRNESVVTERHGCFEEVTSEHGVGLVLGPDIDLRLFLKNWKFGFAVSQKLASGQRESLQFFDNYGNAVLKVYLTADSNREAWDSLVNQFQDKSIKGCSEILDELDEQIPAKPQRLDSEINIESLENGWRELKDTHDFYILLAKNKVGRQQALRLAANDLAHELPLSTVTEVLQQAAANEIPIMAFVGNRGCIQIHTGNINKVAPLHGWMNVLDKAFNLHVNEAEIANIWWVRKPTEDGDVHSVEVYDAGGELIVQFFGARKPGIPERQDWRDLLNKLQPLGEAA